MYYTVILSHKIVSLVLVRLIVIKNFDRIAALVSWHLYRQCTFDFDREFVDEESFCMMGAEQVIQRSEGGCR